MKRVRYNLIRLISSNKVVIERNGELGLWILTRAMRSFVCVITGRNRPAGLDCWRPRYGTVSYGNERISLDGMKELTGSTEAD